MNCTTCHVSPAGGGLMTTYGRSLSKELLSRWGKEGEENILHGALNEKINNWLNGSREVGFNMGGDVRFLQTYMNSRLAEQGRFIKMQRDLEGAFRFYDLTLVSTAGIVVKNDKDEFEARRYYAMYQAGENVSLRVGRFLPIYGLMLPDHNVATRRGLSFDQGKERNVAEVNFIKDEWSGTASYSQSPDTYASTLKEKAGSLQINYAIADKYKLGISHWRGRFDDSQREIYGLHGILGFTHSIYALSEFDYQIQKPNGSETKKGIFYFQKFGYEFTRGLHAIAQVESSQSDLKNSQTKSFSYGAGLMFFPRPHFDFQGLISRAKIQAVDNHEMTYAYLMGHYYF